MSDEYRPVDMLEEFEKLPAERQRAIRERAAELHREVETLKELRQYTDKSQQQVAEALGIRQPSVSRMEAGADMFLSTLRGYIEALGGSLKLVVNLPGREPVVLNEIGDLTDRPGHISPVGDDPDRSAPSQAPDAPAAEPSTPDPPAPRSKRTGTS